MGLFRNRAKKNRDKAAAEVLKEQVRTEQVLAEQVSTEQVLPEQVRTEQVLAEEVRAEPVSPEQVRIEENVPAQAQPEAARREVTAEARPNPDLPGWGRTIGQQIGKPRKDSASQG